MCQRGVSNLSFNADLAAAEVIGLIIMAVKASLIVRYYTQIGTDGSGEMPWQEYGNVGSSASS
jgi:hypothetical protein